MPSKRSRNKKKKLSSQPIPDLVGPDYIQVLTGKLFAKKVNVILCGESHEDAIDVTRSGGYFKPKEGWIPLLSLHTLAEDAAMFTKATMGPSAGTYQFTTRVWKKKSKLASMEKAKEWSNSIMHDGDGGLEMMAQNEDILLVWIRSESTKKGQAYVIAVSIKDFDENGEIIEESCSDDDSDESDNDTEKKSTPKRIVKENTFGTLDAQILDDIRSNLNTLVSNKLNNSNKSIEENKNDGDNSDIFHYTNDTTEVSIFEWNDLDDKARELNRQRLIMMNDNDDKELCTGHHDEIIQKRKEQLQQKEGIWTFDDWFFELKKKNSLGDNSKTVGLHLVLEGGIPPWDVELCQNGSSEKNAENEGSLYIPSAPDCIRCISEDSEGSSMDEFDPSTDGVGSYLDFVNRRFMNEMVSEWNGEEKNTSSQNETWLHCVDSRDLGCDSARVSKSYKEGWMELLSKNAQELLKKIENPELEELTRLRENGLLVDSDSESGTSSPSEDKKKDHDKKNNDEETIDLDSITFPSFEGFFGQNTDTLYYTPNVKTLYAPFLAKCVGSISVWEQFFTNLFFGGTIPDALGLLKLNKNHKQFVHVRSPIQKVWNVKNKEYKWKERDDEEGNVTFPYFPFNCFLKAKGSEPSRTWSSNLYSKLIEEHKDPNCIALATSAKKWTLEAIQSHLDDPKKSDDTEGGGEWFLSFLRANHRIIYDDIDRSDPSMLLHKKFMESEYGEYRKHNIGEITIPTCKKGFDDLAQVLTNLEESDGLEQRKMVSAYVESMSKILIDIWMHNLIDFTTMLKIIEIIVNEKREQVVIVCYMGSVHTKAIGKFFTDVAKLKRTSFVGEYNWDEDSARKLTLPAKLWNLSDIA